MFSHETWHLVDTAFCDEKGRDYLEGWRGCSTDQELLHECAVALKEVANYYAAPVANGQHPLYHLAFYAQVIASSELGKEEAHALSVFVQHAWRLDRNQRMMLVRWLQLLGASIQTRRRN